MKRALVLCGGGSLGSYEIGAWQKLRELGIAFDIVTGTSIGAINGAMVVSGEFDKAFKLWEQIETDEVMNYGIDFDRDFWDEVDFRKGSRFRSFVTSYLKGSGVDITPFKDLLTATVDCHKVVTSKTIFGCIATEFPSTKETRFLFTGGSEENVIPYLLATSACFPIFPKYKIGDKLYIDGGWRNNLPIDYALDLGADEVVAVLLHSFPPNPQKPEYYHDLPNVTLIAPSLPQGSIMSFKKDAIRRNMRLGYLDTGKAYKEYRGFVYTFSKDENIGEASHYFFKKLLGKGMNVYLEAKKLLTHDGKEPQSEEDLYLRNLERLAALYQINPIEIYKPSELAKMVFDFAIAFVPDKTLNRKRLSPEESEKWYLLEVASRLDSAKGHHDKRKIEENLDRIFLKPFLKAKALSEKPKEIKALKPAQ